MPTNLIRYDGVNDPQQNIVDIDLSAIPDGTIFTADILYCCRAFWNYSAEQSAMFRYIVFCVKYSQYNYAIIKDRNIVEVGFNSNNYLLFPSIDLFAEILHLDLINPNTDTTVLFDCKLQY
jgi:hypothetical protein